MSESAETTVTVNRTGLAMSPDAEELESSVESFIPIGTPQEFHAFRIAARAGAPPIGSTPSPASLLGVAKEALRSLVGAPESALLDKLSERLAFERTGTRLYDTLLEKLDQGSFPGGPSRTDLERIRDDEAAHFRMLDRVIRDLDGDPTAVSPSADLAAVASSGVMAVVVDARTTLGESLEAILIAELVDHDAWGRLIDLAVELGKDELAERFRVAEDTEDEHLGRVRAWVAAYAAASRTGAD